MITMLFVLTVGLQAAVAQPLAANASPQWYLDAWSQQEKAARKPELRAALAKDLLESARHENDREQRLLLANKAFTWGGRDLEGYVWAADALNLIQQTDPSQRLWSLEQMAGLYESAYRARPTKLRLGSGWGETLMELAQQRLDSADDSFDAGDTNTAETIGILRQCQADLQRAGSSLQQVIHRAESDAAKVKAIGRNDLAGSLEKFAAEFRPKLDDINTSRDQIARQMNLLTQLQGAENRYKIRPSTVTADPLAILYVAQFDKPERVDDAMLKQVSEPIARNITLACKSPEDLSADQAAAMSAWYMGLIADATGDDAKLDLATRAAVYARRVIALGAGNGQALLDRAIAAAAPLGSQNGYFDTRIRDLQAQLNWRYGHRPAATAAATPATHAAVPPAAHTETSTNTGPDTTAPAVSVADHTVAAPIKGEVRNGRPMTICAKCGREFFAGWGDDHATLCPRCSSGRKNIFDFGEE